MNIDTPFKLFSNCLVVKGASRSLICDLQRNSLKLIPNDLADILNNFDGKTINIIQKGFDNKYDDIIIEYFQFLIENEFVFFTHNPEKFPKLSMEWDHSSLITNAILDWYKDSDYNLLNAIWQLDNLKCSNVEIRFFDSINLKFIEQILTRLDNKGANIISVDFLLPYRCDFQSEEFLKLLKQYPRIASFKIFNAREDKYFPSEENGLGYLVFSTMPVTDESHCGLINEMFFISNLPMYTESQKFNSCLNRKISVDKKGWIKNCPSLINNYGHIKETSLKDVLKDEEFKKLWNINKDNIHGCKDCEFRHVCTDCRAYIENPKDIYSKPLKCGYNPYTNEWDDWKLDKKKQKVIKSYHLTDM